MHRSSYKKRLSIWVVSGITGLLLANCACSRNEQSRPGGTLESTEPSSHNIETKESHDDQPYYDAEQILEEDASRPSNQNADGPGMAGDDDQMIEPEQAETQVSFDDVMDWKYRDEILLKRDDPDVYKKIREMYDNAGGKRVQIHFQFDVRSSDELEKLARYSSTFGKMVTTFEVLIPDGVLSGHGYHVRVMIDRKADTRLIVSGMGDKPVELSHTHFDLVAGSVVMDNFTFHEQREISAISADIEDCFVANNLSFKDNAYPKLLENEAQPLIKLKSHASEKNYSNYRLTNVSFVNNQSRGLLSIDSDSLEKFDYIVLDHVVAKYNNNWSGINISAINEALIKNCEFAGGMIAATVYHNIPQTQVKFVNSSVSGRVCSYLPLKQYWHVDPRPVIKENLTEAEGTVFDRVP